MTNHPTTHRRPSAAQSLFERDVRAGRTGMILHWHDLTPRQRASYRKAAAEEGLSYSVTADQFIAQPIRERAKGA